MPTTLYPGGDNPVTPNFGLALWDMSFTMAENFEIIDQFLGGGGGSSSFSSITSGTNINHTLTVGNLSSLTFSGSGVVNANELNGIVISGALTHAGQILISQPGNTTAIWADPLVQGIQAEGTTASTVNPVLVAGKDGAGNLKDLVLDGSGNLLVNVAAGSLTLAANQSVNVNQIGGVAITEGQKVMASSFPVVIASDQSAIPVSGTVAVSSVAGSVAVTGTFFQATQPVSGTVTTVPPANASTNLTQVAGVTLGATAVTVFGTAPAAANVPGANVSLFSGTTALTNTAGALNVNITSSGSAQTIAGNKSNNSVAPGATNLGVLPGIANAATQTWTEGDQVLESMDLSGRQRVRGTITNNNAAPTADLQGTITCLANAAAPSWTEGNMVLHSVDLSGNTRVIGTKLNNNAAPSTQVAVIPALANAAAPTWTEGDQVLLSVDLAGNQRVKLGASAVVIGHVITDSGSTTAVTGTVAVTQSTSPWVDNLTQWASTVLGVPTNFGTTPGAVIAGSVNASMFAGTTALAATGSSLNVNITGGSSGNAAAGATGSAVPASADYQGLNVGGTLRGQTGVNPTGVVYASQIDLTSENGVSLGSPAAYGTSPGAVNVIGVNAFVTNTPAVTLASTTITGTVAVTQSTSPWVENLTQVASTALGATAVVAFGTAPAAGIVPGVNASLFSGTTALTNTAGALNVNVSTAPLTTINLTQWASTVLGVPTNFGTTPGAVIAGSVNASLFSGTTLIGNASGALSVSITNLGPNTPVGAFATGTAPAGALGVLTQYNTSAPVPSNGQTVSLQSDSWGDLIVRPFRRGKMVAQATTITANTLTTVLAAQGAAVFADISNLIITVTPSATADIAFTCSLTDGTLTYVFDMDTGALATATAPPTLININFNPPLPATTSNTVWSITNSSATPTTHVTVVAVQQKAG